MYKKKYSKSLLPTSLRYKNAKFSKSKMGFSYGKTRYSGKTRSIYPTTSIPERKVIDFDPQPFPFSYGTPNALISYNAGQNGFSVVSNAVATPAQNVGLVMTPPLNNVSTGPDSFHRVGTRINLSSIYLQFMVRYQDEVAAQTIKVPLTFRILLILDKQSNGAAYGSNTFIGPFTLTNPDCSSIIVPTNFGKTGAGLDVAYCSPSSPVSLDNRDRFRILMDYRDNLSPEGKTECVFNKYISLKGIQSQFNSVANAGISTNAIFLMFVSDANIINALDARPCVKFHSRVRFTDP